MTTKKKYIQHNKQCFACGQEKAPSFLGYDIKTLKTYCLNKCKNKKDIPAVELIPATNEELVSGIVGNYSKDDEETIMSLLGKVASTRLRPAHILHVMKIAEMEGLPSLQATMLNIIEADMAARSMDDVELESYGQEREPEEETHDDLTKYDEEIAKAIGGMPEPVAPGFMMPDLQKFAPPAPPEPSLFEKELVKARENSGMGEISQRMDELKVIINDKPVEPAKEEESDDDNPFEF